MDTERACAIMNLMWSVLVGMDDSGSFRLVASWNLKSIPSSLSEIKVGGSSMGSAVPHGPVPPIAAWCQ